MSDENNQKKVSRLQENPGLFTGMTNTIRLVFHLVADSRVNFLLKLLPIGSLIYLVSPLDAALPVIDDAIILGLGTYAFIELCPPEIVEEHRARLTASGEPAPSNQDESEVIDTSFTEID